MNTTVTKTNDCLLDSFSETFNILDATISEIKIYMNKKHLIVELYMKLSYPHNMNLKLCFSGVKEYSFYWNDNHIFYNIESYKLFKANNLFYMSLDPDGEENEISQNDQDFILCENIEGSFFEDVML